MRRKIWLLCFGLLAIRAMAEKVSVSSEPSWIYKVNPKNTGQPPSGAISDGYYLELADHQVNLGTQTEYRHVIRNITNESGVQNASEVSVVFSPSFQKIIFHKISLWRNGQIINQFTPSQIQVVQEETDAGDFQYNGLKRAFVDLKGVQKNDKIEYSYSIIGFNPVFSAIYSNKFYLVNNTYIANFFETYFVPAGRQLKIKSFNQAPLPTEEQQGNLHIYRWDNPVIKENEAQTGVPDWFDNFPAITVTEFDSWKQVADWGLSLLQHYNYPISEALQKQAKDWKTSAHGDRDLYANIVMRFVQDQVRYLGLEMGTYTHQPHQPSDVFRQRYGDCKDKALLLATLLRLDSIDAYVALVNTNIRAGLIKEAPSAKSFDHAIVAIPRSGNFVYVDATASYQRGELVNTFIPNYGYALVLQEGLTALQPVQAGSIYNINIEEKLDIYRGDSCRMKVETIYLGGAADDNRESFAGASSRELKESFEKYYSKTYEGIRLVADPVIKDDSSKNELTIVENYTMPSLWHNNTKGRKSIEVFAKAVYDLIPDPAGLYNNAPASIPYPRNLHYVLTVEMPEDWQFSNGEIHIKNDSYQFDFVPEVTGRIIRLRYSYQTFKDHIPVEEVATYKSDYKKIYNNLDFEFYYSDSTGAETETGKSLPVSKSTAGWLMTLLILLITGIIMYGRRSTRR